MFSPVALVTQGLYPTIFSPTSVIHIGFITTIEQLFDHLSAATQGLYPSDTTFHSIAQQGLLDLDVDITPVEPDYNLGGSGSLFSEYPSTFQRQKQKTKYNIKIVLRVNGRTITREFVATQNVASVMAKMGNVILPDPILIDASSVAAYMISPTVEASHVSTIKIR